MAQPLAAAGAAHVSNMSTNPAAFLTRCSVYAHDIADSTPSSMERVRPGLAQWTPADWASNQYAFEWHLARAVRSHAWRVPKMTDAELVFGAANWSLMCVAKMQLASRRQWQEMLDDAALFPRANRSAVCRGASPARGCFDARARPVFMAFQYGGCLPPWQAAAVPPNALLLRETVLPRSHELRTNFLGPFAVTTPRWLVGAEAAPAAPPWEARKLVFMAGHVPKLYLSRHRYSLWLVLRSDPRATVVSKTLNCSIGSYSVCRRGDAYVRAQPHTFFRDFCKPFCEPLEANVRCSGYNERDAQTHLAEKMVRQCRAYRKVNYTDELPDMVRDTRRLPHDVFLAESLRHRFCLIPPGDVGHASPKISEGIALGAARGCIPVIVLPFNSARETRRFLGTFLPFTRWLDYCSVAYLVPARTVYRAALVRDLVERLSRVTAAEAAAKHAALARVRDAFVLRGGEGGGGDAAPTAADFVLGEACEIARRRRRDEPPALPVGGDHRSCVLGELSD